MLGIRLPEIALPLPLARAVLHPLFRIVMYARMPWAAQRVLLDAASALQIVPAGTRVQRIRLGGRATERIAGSHPAAPGAVLYLHGGGYTVGSPSTHRSLAAHVAAELHRPVYLLDYRLAPEHPYPAALDDAENAFLELTATGVPAGQIAVAGDSAGGGLALALAQRLRDRHGCRPAALGLIAPWADPGAVPSRVRDLVINTGWSRACAAAYLGSGDPADPGYAPLLGPLSGLPPTYIQVDTDELLFTQGIRLTRALRAAGIETRLDVTTGLWHVAQLQASLVPAAAAALRAMTDFLAEILRSAPERSLG